jgi:anion-transporting  ArsA/GET3 family ATPase
MTQSLNIQEIQTKLTQSLKDLYQLALNADEQLEQLKNDEKGKFSAIFQKDSGFMAEANRFLPYLIELNDEIRSLPIMDAENQPPKIQAIVKRIKMMHEVLAQFHSIRDTKDH